jgi:hypothetical protein
VKYVITAILGFFAAVLVFVFGKRTNVHDNGNGASGIRDSLADSKNRADDITEQIVHTSGTIVDITEHIGSASTSLDRAIGIVRSIRRRGATAGPVAQTGPDRD